MISRQMQIEEMNSSRVVFRTDIDSAQPEVIRVSVTRERWENEFKEATRCRVVLTLPHEEISDL